MAKWCVTPSGRDGEGNPIYSWGELNTTTQNAVISALTRKGEAYTILPDGTIEIEASFPMTEWLARNEERSQPPVSPRIPHSFPFIVHRDINPEDIRLDRTQASDSGRMSVEAFLQFAQERALRAEITQYEPEMTRGAKIMSKLHKNIEQAEDMFAATRASWGNGSDAPIDDVILVTCETIVEAIKAYFTTPPTCLLHIDPKTGESSLSSGVDLHRLNNDALHAIIEDAEATAQERKEKEHREQVIQESLPYLDEALLYLGGQGYTIRRSQLYPYPDLYTYTIIPPPDRGTSYYLIIREQVSKEREGLTRCAVDVLGNLREWHEKQLGIKEEGE